jgi:hypothetical protein
MPITASSCLDLFNDGVGDNGPYTVNVPGVGEMEVHCDMTTPQAVGRSSTIRMLRWVTCQRRLGLTVSTRLHRIWASTASSI